MTDMRNAAVCWAPECSNVPAPSRGSRPSRYCSPGCRVKALRRNGGTAPSEPYPPLVPEAHHPVVVPPMPLPPQPPAEDDTVVPPQKPPKQRTVKVPPKETPPEPPQTGGEGSGAAPVAEDQPAPDAEGTVTQLHIAVTQDSTIPVAITVHPMVAQYRADLERMKIADTRQGLHIIAMAEKLVSSSTSAAAATTVSKELERLMDAAEENTPAARIGRDPSAAIRERTIAKLTAVSA